MSNVVAEKILVQSLALGTVTGLGWRLGGAPQQAEGTGAASRPFVTVPAEDVL